MTQPEPNPYDPTAPSGPPAYPSGPPAYPTAPPAAGQPAPSGSVPVPPGQYPAAPAYPGYGTPTGYAQGPGGYAPMQADPGQGFSIGGLVLAFFFSPVGLVLSIMGRSRSKKAGYNGTLGTVGMVLNIVFLVLSIAAIITLIVFFVHFGSVCAEYGSGSHYIDGRTYSCP